VKNFGFSHVHISHTPISHVVNYRFVPRFYGALLFEDWNPALAGGKLGNLKPGHNAAAVGVITNSLHARNNILLSRQAPGYDG
jgi:hypothetical protein